MASQHFLCGFPEITMNIMTILVKVYVRLARSTMDGRLHTEEGNSEQIERRNDQQDFPEQHLARI